MIQVGENPEMIPGINKFIAKSGDGLRGKVIAIRRDGKQAVMLAMNGSLEGDVEWGKFYLVEENDAGNYPEVIGTVDEIPCSGEWKIL